MLIIAVLMQLGLAISLSWISHMSTIVSTTQMNGEERCGQRESWKVLPLQRYPVKDGCIMALSAIVAKAQNTDLPETCCCWVDGMILLGPMLLRSIAKVQGDSSCLAKWLDSVSQFSELERAVEHVLDQRSLNGL